MNRISKTNISRFPKHAVILNNYDLPSGRSSYEQLAPSLLHIRLLNIKLQPISIILQRIVPLCPGVL